MIWVKAPPSNASLNAKERKAGPAWVKKARVMVNLFILLGGSCRTWTGREDGSARLKRAYEVSGGEQASREKKQTMIRRK